MTTVNKLMIGVAAGAILGVLYAPDKGSVTRRKLARTGNDLREGFNCVTDAISEKIDSFKGEARDIAYEEEVYQSEAAVNPPSWSNNAEKF